MNPDGSPDKNAESFYETSNGLTVSRDLMDGTGDTAAAKITSHCTDFRLKAKRIIGGSENCVDINNECNGVSVYCENYEIKGKYGLSAKTSKNIFLYGHLQGTPSQWHVNLGSWSDQSNAIQDNTRLILTADVYPIVVWVGNATIPSLDDASKYKLIGFGVHGPVVRGLVMFLWGIAKKLHLA